MSRRRCLVPDAAIGAAQRMIWNSLRLVAEPGGATALAALLCGAFVPPDLICTVLAVYGVPAPIPILRRWLNHE